MIVSGKQGVVLIVTFLLGLGLTAQESEDKPRFFDNWKIKPVVATQFWATYTTNAQLFDRDSMRYIDVDGRLNFSLRRTRLGAKVNAGEDVTLNLIAAIDNVGRDILSGQPGGANNGPFPQVQLWNAYVKWRLKSGSEAINLVIGYHLPHFSRESPTVWPSIGSLEKSQSQAYIRRHLTGKNPGRSVGISAGGILFERKERFLLHYSVGIFNSIFGSSVGNSAGIKSSPLVTGRLMVTFGEPESKEYSITHRFNALSRRTGLSIAVSGSYEGENDLFASSYAVSADFLYNWKNLNLSGEASLLYREGDREPDGQELRTFTTNAAVYALSLSYNIHLKKGHILEPGISYMHFDGADSRMDIEDALAVNASAGTNSYVDIGASYHVIPGKLKIDLHYIAQSGNQVESNPGDSINDFFFQSGFAIRRGDYIGAGVVFVL